MLRNNRQSYSEIEKSGDNIYVNIVINHNDMLGSKPSMAEFVANYTDLILEKADEYFLSIIRFSIPGQLIPIFIFPILPFPNTNVNGSPFFITMKFGAVTSTPQQVIYVPNGKLPGIGYNGIPFPVPPAPSASHPFQTITDYYFVYAYQYMLDMVNTTIAQAFTALNAAVPGGLPVGALPPYFIYDATTQLISLIAQSAFYDETLATPIQLYFNTALQQPYFEAIPVHFLGYDGDPGVTTNLNFLFQIKDNGNNYYYPPGGQKIVNNVNGANTSISTSVGAITTTRVADIQWYKMQQEYNVLSYWSSFKNIIFTTGSIPIQYEQAPFNQPLNSQEVSNSFPILTDFNPLLQYAGDQRSVLQYYPQGPYRLINLNSSIGLRKIDVKLYWQDQKNNLYPIFIPVEGSINIKLLFIKKSMYKNSLNNNV